MPPPPPLTDTQAIMDQIRQIVHALEKGSKSAQRTLGLSGAQLFSLQTLAAAGPLSVNGLAALTHTHQSSVSVVVSRLVESRFVKRTPSAIDARRLELTVTPAGRRALESGFVTPQEKLLRAIDRFPARRRVLKPLSSAISIGSGGPFGAEGPIIATGGALGSLFGQLIQTSASERKALLAAGAAAGMTATFGTPLAADPTRGRTAPIRI